MTIAELRALPVGRGQIGEVRYLPVGVAPVGRGRGQGGRDVSASIARIGVKLPVVGQNEEPKCSGNMVREELDSLKPTISENPWVRNDVKRNKLLEKMKSFVSSEETDLPSLVNPDAPEEEKNSSKREDLKRELDEVLRGIREMGGVGAICASKEAEKAAQSQVAAAAAKLRPKLEGRRRLAGDDDKARRIAEKLWKTDAVPSLDVENDEDVEEVFENLIAECGATLDDSIAVTAEKDGNVDVEGDAAASTESETSGSTSSSTSSDEDEEVKRALGAKGDEEKKKEGEDDEAAVGNGRDVGEVDDDDDEAYISITAL